MELCCQSVNPDNFEVFVNEYTPWLEVGVSYRWAVKLLIACMGQGFDIRTVSMGPTRFLRSAHELDIGESESFFHIVNQLDGSNG